ncbi:hypothetical protein EDD53_0575 [Pacificibacter maritimus]|uniref:Antifreeze glycopeptide polyprotein n=1 Tax=Pacificibacter maritimus TaxID=762213 RepID=A0A3N4ULD4_9RHOB|nr:hypothetical protein [Pacificibacter maritimus]RPE71456.1 hypothetical protein EDD53_0575 [Pacificibacter maritimus]
MPSRLHGRKPAPRGFTRTSLIWLAVLVIGCPQVGLAQSNAQKPLSAIDWLTDSIDAPAVRPTAPQPTVLQNRQEDIANNALPEDVTITAIDAPRIDATGILSTAQTGLPPALWGASKPQDLGRRMMAIANQTDLLPASRRLLNTLLLAELDPPVASGSDGRLFQSRIDALLKQGLIEEANALLDRAGSTDPDLFRRSFDVKLLLGTENQACATMKSTPSLTPALPTRIFCLARSGDWDAAALTLDTSTTLGLISDQEADLLARFLDPDLYDNAPPKNPPNPPTPLSFRMMEAIGAPMSTQYLPLAFAQSDLEPSTGWKFKATAAERLARVGAITPNAWLGIWTEHLPAASGGIWDRIEALQRFDTALKTGDPTGISNSLSRVWPIMRDSGLQSVFADLFAEKLGDAPLTDTASDIAFEVVLLSSHYETIAAEWDRPLDNRQSVLRSIALGDIPEGRLRAGSEKAIIDGFRSGAVPVRLSGLVQSNRLGEAILRAIELLESGADGDLDELTDSIAFLRAVGLEATARRAALEILLLERRG